MQIRRVGVLVVSTAVVMLPIVGWAQKGDLTHGQPAVQNATVEFGVLATAPIGPPPCSQVPPFGGPADPCSFRLHHLTPEEVTIQKEGQVTLQVHGGGHAVAIYEVSKDTTRDDIGQYLCVGDDPSTFTDTTQHNCLATSQAGVDNAGANHTISDGKGNVVIVSGVTGAFPANRVWSEPGRLMSAGAVQFLNPPPSTAGELVTYQFLKTGRYLVICMNRSHLLNDWMFGFVNVVGGK